ncbi:suppressor APC domain-containing protein 2 [Xenopus laevis]|uniref:Suppressor APC domain-containing protein 2 n=2 Tax=Xenopus laevis TaxID=8355 RepID=A0A1L8F8I7_XENLA|nr:suppressor APC domain-containing protein 2 [Xenopus laevis]OCT67912.1 hypothetical protein XELAEV_18039210mg [Xenopus laevis]
MSSLLLPCPPAPTLPSMPSSFSTSVPCPSLQSCPSRGFLHNLRILYRILEEEGGGQVHVQDIENLWAGPSILSCVPQALRDATASSGGYLSFPRLVRGLTQALRAGESQETDTRKKRGIKGVTRSHSINNDVTNTLRHMHQEQRARRHTLTSAIDYNTLRRMKELEQERDALLDGLQLVDKAREWYRDKLREAEQHKKLQCDMDLPTVPPPPLLGSSLMVQIQEVNRFLSKLISPPEKVSRRHDCTTAMCDTLNTLKYQNELLNKELSMQSERLWKLQRENTALYRELEERHPPRATFI